MKLIVSYSCGKDSALSLHKVLHQGHEVCGLLITVNGGQNRSWFHGVNMPLIRSISASVRIPVLECRTSGEDYDFSFEEALKKAKDEYGIEGCVFGDIDIEEHRTWCSERCKNAGTQAIFPLWQKERAECVRELISLGYKAVVKCIRNDLLDKEILGRALDNEMIAYFNAKQTDVCGENGEYHTVVVDGPIFKTPLKYTLGEQADFGTLSAVEIHAQ